MALIDWNEMAGAPVPVPMSSDAEEKILSVKDLERAAERKLGRNARGLLMGFWTLFAYLLVALGFCVCMKDDNEDMFFQFP